MEETAVKVAMWHGGKDIRIEDAPKPRIKRGEALIRVRAVGICGSELHVYEGISKRRVPPLVMGHEFSGEVAEVEDGAAGIQKGDRVAVEPIIRCGTCEQCARGRSNICSNMRLMGLHMTGAFAEYVAVPAEKCYKIPDNVSFEEGSTAEPLSVGLHAVNRASIGLGDAVVVLGAGVIGLMSVQAAKIAGAAKVLVTDLFDYRLKLARKLGADAVINVKEEDPVKVVMELTDGKGVDAILEAVGIQKTMQQAMTMVKKGGVVTAIGMLAKTMELEMLDAVVRETELKGSYGYTPGEFKSALGLIGAGRVDVKSLITHVFPLRDIVKGFEALSEKKEGVVKVVIKP